MDKYDMTSLFCNLLDNAVEAATGYPNAFIEIYADFSKSMTYNKFRKNKIS